MGATWAVRGLPVEEERAASRSRAGESRHKGRARDTGQRPDGDTAGDGGPGPHPRSMGTPGHGPAAVRLRSVPSSCHRVLPPSGPRGLHGVLTRLRATGSGPPAPRPLSAATRPRFPSSFSTRLQNRSELCGDPGPSHRPPCKQRNGSGTPLRGPQCGTPVTIHPSVIFTSKPRAIPAGPTCPTGPCTFVPIASGSGTPDVYFNFIIKEEC